MKGKATLQNLLNMAYKSTNTYHHKLVYIFCYLRSTTSIILEPISLDTKALSCENDFILNKKDKQIFNSIFKFRHF